jgi:hypothetical protein
MGPKIVATLSSPTLILLTAFGLASVGQSQDSTIPYGKMAPIDQYLTSESAAQTRASYLHGAWNKSRKLLHTRRLLSAMS